MKRSIIAFSMLVLLFAVSAPAEDAGRFGVGVNYGIINNFRMWDNASSESGSALRVNYSYDFSDLYTLAIEIGFVADDNVFKNASVVTVAETGSFLNIDHIFRTRKVGMLSPYLKLGTGIFAVNLWQKRTDNRFYNLANNIIADLNAGLGADFKIGNALMNVDLFFPALLNELYLSARPSYILSLGCKWVI